MGDCKKMECVSTYDGDLNLNDTELRLGLPGMESPTTSSSISNKRAHGDTVEECRSKAADDKESDDEPPAKAQRVGWPPIRSYRKNNLQTRKMEAETAGVYLKVFMDGAPYLRKIDLKVYKSYPELLKALGNMFKCFTLGDLSYREGNNGSEYVPTYEDKDGDWMLVGDVPWDMFTSSCKRLRIMKGTEARGLGSGL